MRSQACTIAIDTVSDEEAVSGIPTDKQLFSGSSGDTISIYIE